MSSSFLMYGTVVGVALVGFFATMWIGASRENKEGNPAYEKNSIPNWIRLTLIYMIVSAVSIGLLIWFIRQQVW